MYRILPGGTRILAVNDDHILWSYYNVFGLIIMCTNKTLAIEYQAISEVRSVNGIMMAVDYIETTQRLEHPAKITIDLMFSKMYTDESVKFTFNIGAPVPPHIFAINSGVYVLPRTIHELLKLDSRYIDRCCRCMRFHFLVLVHGGLPLEVAQLIVLIECELIRQFDHRRYSTLISD